MTVPKMILFDYGQTLVSEQFDGVRGTEAVLQYAIRNKYQKSAAQVQAVADEINQELGRFDPKKQHLFPVEVPNFMFTNYLYESQGIELSIKGEELEGILRPVLSDGSSHHISNQICDIRQTEAIQKRLQ